MNYCNELSHGFLGEVADVHGALVLVAALYLAETAPLATQHLGSLKLALMVFGGRGREARVAIVGSPSCTYNFPMLARALPTILVVDDNELLRMTIAEAFELEGYVAEVAVDGAEALARLTTRRIDAIVLDLMLRVLDGWAFVEACRNLPRDRQAPIVLISAAYALPAAAAHLKASGYEPSWRSPSIWPYSWALSTA